MILNGAFLWVQETQKVTPNQFKLSELKSWQYINVEGPFLNNIIARIHLPTICWSSFKGGMVTDDKSLC